MSENPKWFISITQRMVTRQIGVHKRQNNNMHIIQGKINFLLLHVTCYQVHEHIRSCKSQDVKKQPLDVIIKM
jgi:hypothetical protein